MCYDVSYLTKRAEKYAERYGTVEDWEDMKKRLPATFHASGFDEPELPVITGTEPDKIQAYSWSYIPGVYAPTINGRPINTLNARDDKIFQTKSVYNPAVEKGRCLVAIDGFFDHHKKNGIAYPFYVTMADDSPLFLAGLWQNFRNDEIERNTCTLITTKANKEMAWIHNEPAYSAESRMVYVVPPENFDRWLFAEENEAKKMITPLADGVLKYHSCQPVKSNKKLNRVYLGNVPEISSHRYYPDLEENQGSLF